MPEKEQSVYEMVGGHDVFVRLVESFYNRIEADPYLRPMFPEDLAAGKHWQVLFLIQFFGGPSHYMVERGHPRLRMRHSPFIIDQQGRDHWYKHMCDAIDEVGIQEPARGIMRDYFDRASSFMINAEHSASNLMHWQQTPKD